MLDKKLEVAPQYMAYEHNRQVEPLEPTDLDGTQVFPVAPLYHKSNNGEQRLALRKTFDKVEFRNLPKSHPSLNSSGPQTSVTLDSRRQHFGNTAGLTGTGTSSGTVGSSSLW